MTEKQRFAVKLHIVLSILQYVISEMTTVQKSTNCEKQSSTQIQIPVDVREAKREFRWVTVIGGVLLGSVLVWVAMFNLNLTENTPEFPTGEVTHVTRDQWMAQSPDNELKTLQSPVSRVIIAHTATEGCTIRVSTLQSRPMFINF
jgi:uncharacterized membrane protein